MRGIVVIQSIDQWAMRKTLSSVSLTDQWLHKDSFSEKFQQRIKQETKMNTPSSETISTNTAGSGSEIHVQGRFNALAGSVVYAERDSKVYAFDSSTVYAEAGSLVHALSGSTVFARADSTVLAHRGSTVHADEQSKLTKFKGATVHTPQWLALRSPNNNIHTATATYERWLARHTEIVRADLAQKHKLMRRSAFILLRGTFYRWAELFPATLPELMKAPVVLAVGDLHIENFGSWRDAEGRLNWGVNDFDEAYMLPFTNDLVRLATSAAFAIEAGKLSLSLKNACAVIVRAYQATLVENGRPFVLAEKNRELGDMARNKLKDPCVFFSKLNAQSETSGLVPDTVVKLFEKSLPSNVSKPVYFHRRAGVGSLGRQRYVAVYELGGSRIVREAKAVLPSAWNVAHPEAGKPTIYLNQLSESCLRSHDPFLRVEGEWIIRRLAPDCARIELSDLPDKRDEQILLEAMAAETANIHLGSAQVSADIIQFLNKNSDWLFPATRKMVWMTKRDFLDWQVG